MNNNSTLCAAGAPNCQVAVGEYLRIVDGQNGVTSLQVLNPDNQPTSGLQIRGVGGNARGNLEVIGDVAVNNQGANGGNLTTTRNVSAGQDVNSGRDVNAGRNVSFGESLLTPDEGGSIELGGRNNVAGGGTPYIDFHNSALAENFNVRIVNNGNRYLTITGSGGGEVTLDVDGDQLIRGDQLVERRIAARDVVSTELSRSLNQAVYQRAIVVDNTRINKPNCPPPLTPRIFVTPVAFAQGALSPPVHSVSAFAVDRTNFWTAQITIVTSEGTFPEPDPQFNKVLAEWGCE